jgi:hypothetical protein
MILAWLSLAYLSLVWPGSWPEAEPGKTLVVIDEWKSVNEGLHSDRHLSWGKGCKLVCLQDGVACNVKCIFSIDDVIWAVLYRSD